MTKIVPRYLYHITTKANYDSIMKSGILKTSEDDLLGNGIFAVELTNLFKRWNYNKNWGNKNLQEKLLKHQFQKSPNIVMIKIPTGNLDLKKLKIRSQNTLFQYIQKMRQYYIDLIKNTFSAEEIKTLRHEVMQKVNFMDPKELRLKSPKHLIFGTPVRFRKLFQQRKEAIEYIYKDNIPASQISKIGEININELEKSTEFDSKKPIRSIFCALLKNTPEENGAKLIKF